MNRNLLTVALVFVLAGCGAPEEPDVKNVEITTTSAKAVTSETSVSATTTTGASSTTGAPSTTSKPTTTAAATTVKLTTMSPPTTAPPEPAFTGSVLVVVDSMIVETAGALNRQSTADIQIDVAGQFGATPCDALNRIENADRYDRVIFAYSGNGSFLSPCMTADQDADLYGTYLGAYRQLESLVGANKMRVVLAPVWNSDGYAKSLDARRAANDWSVSVGYEPVDAAALLGGQDYFSESARIPSDPAGFGPVALRAADGLHLCDVEGYSSGDGLPCPENASAGVERYALGIMGAIEA